MPQKFCSLRKPMLQKLCSPWKLMPQKFCSPWKLMPQKFCGLWKSMPQKFSSMAWACCSHSTGNHYRQSKFSEAFPAMALFFCKETISLSMSLCNNAFGNGSLQSKELCQWPVPYRNSQNTWPQSKVWLENHLPSGWALPFLWGFYTVCKSEIWNVNIIINYTWTFRTKPNQCVFIGKNQKE